MYSKPIHVFTQFVEVNWGGWNEATEFNTFAAGY